MEKGRLNVLKLENRDYDGIDSGTSAEYIAINVENGKKGIYKPNGCMLNVENEDLREKLASNILNKVGIDAALIELTYDEENNQNGCFSYYILDEDEIFAKQENIHVTTTVCEISKYIDVYANTIENCVGITNEHIEERKKHIAKLIYMDCILDNYDRKADNMEIIYNTKNGEYRNAPTYDYGVAFKRDSVQKNGPFFDIEKEDVFRQIVSEYYKDIKEVSANVKNEITEDYLKEVLTEQNYIEGFGETDIKNIISNILENVQISEKLCEESEKKLNVESDFVKDLKKATYDGEEYIVREHNKKNITKIEVSR